MLRIIVDAIKAVDRNVGALVLYCAICLLGSAGLRLTCHLLLGPDGEAAAPASAQGLLLLLDVVLAAIAAMAQAIAFARIGRDIDRPLYKVRDDKEALKRFFVMWLCLNLMLLLLIRVGSAILAIWQDEVLFLMVMMVIAAVTATIMPAGACVMFAGRFSWPDLREHLAPLGNQLPQTALIVLLSFLAYAATMDIALRFAQEHWLLPLVADLASCYWDCVVFAAVWLLCMQDRDAPQEYDLDF